jgi:cell division protein FtsB
MKNVNVLIALSMLSSVIITSCNSSDNSELESKVKILEAEVQKYKNEREMVKTHITRFDSLDFDIYSKQNWKDISISHTDDIIVHYPDGHKTDKLSPHIDEMKPLFSFAPDTRVVAHPVKFGTGEWTCVIGQTEGTFSKPMAIGGGKFIQPTGKKYSMPMVTIGRWKDGKMVEEWLFWDNALIPKQIGLTN